MSQVVYYKASSTRSGTSHIPSSFKLESLVSRLSLPRMDMSKKPLGPEHPSTFISMGNLAIPFRDQEKWNEAEQLEVQVRQLGDTNNPNKVLDIIFIGMLFLKIFKKFTV